MLLRACALALSLLLAHPATTRSAPLGSHSNNASSALDRLQERSHAFVEDFYDPFDYGLDGNNWDLELTQFGGGNGEFQMYVNSYQTFRVENSTLLLKPTLTEHIMEELHAAGADFVAKRAFFEAEDRQGISADHDKFYQENVGNFYGRREVLPFKHVRYQTASTNVCFDNITSDQSAPCDDMWASRYNSLDMGTQVWTTGEFTHSRCVSGGGCKRTAGEAFELVDVETGLPAPHFSMLQPTASSKVVSRMNLDVRFGKLEIRAKLPRGDWLWPAMWMMPTYKTYGLGDGNGWPMNGEIDIMEARGNTPSACDYGGFNQYGSALHWGPDPDSNMYDKTFTSARFRQAADERTLIDEFHTYGLVWDENTLYTYIDSEDNKVLEVDRTDQSFWEFGQESSEHCKKRDALAGVTGPLECYETETVPGADWAGRENLWDREKSTNMAPFDKPFSLQFNVAVGGNPGGEEGGYFPDGDLCNGADGSTKPWKFGDNNFEAFMQGAHAWLPTWVEPEHVPWAAHCALGSATESCMPSAASIGGRFDPADLTVTGTSDAIKDWYEASKSTCNVHTSEDGCPTETNCEWRAKPCPPIADHTALQIDSVQYWKPAAGSSDGKRMKRHSVEL